MRLSSANFKDEDINLHAMGAGVIPISCDEEGQLFLLLGRERWTLNWKGSCRWSGFEGSRKSDESIVENATREFLEESLCVVMDSETLQRRLEQNDYWIRIVLSIENERRLPRYHATYVIPVPWRSDVCKAFQNLRTDLEKIDRLVQEWHHTRPVYILGESDEIVGPVTTIDHESTTDASDIHVRILKERKSMPSVMRLPWRCAERDSSLVEAVQTLETSDELMQWVMLREQLDKAIVDHPSVRVVRDDRWGLVQDVYVLHDYMEKDQVRWWRYEDLKKVMEKRGHSGNERFRPYFLPVLQSVLTEIENVGPDVLRQKMMRPN